MTSLGLGGALAVPLGCVILCSVRREPRPAAALERTAVTVSTLFDFSTRSIAGQRADFAARRGDVFLLVNTASACGFTPQFKGLEKLWRDYRDKGLVVVGFPCNQFGAQDPGSDREIASF